MAAGWLLFLGTMAATAGTPPAPLVFRQDIEVIGPRVSLGDIVDVSVLPPPLRKRAASLPIADFRPRHDRLELSSRRVRERVRALLPAAASWFGDAAETRITVRLATRAQHLGIAAGLPSSPACLRVVEPLPAGSIATSADFEPGPCGATAASASFVYDPQARAVRATRSLQSGEAVEAVPSFALMGVRPGQRVYVHASVGPVRLSREVEAVQPALPGQRLFVRTADGTVFAATLGEIDR